MNIYIDNVAHMSDRLAKQLLVWVHAPCEHWH